MIDRTKYAKQLLDGTDVCGTLEAAHEYGATPPALTAAAMFLGLILIPTATSPRR